MVKSIVIKKLIEDFLPEDIACSARRYHKASLSFFWITPHHVAKRAVVRDLLESVEALDLLHRLDHRRESSVDGKDVLFNDG